MVHRLLAAALDEGPLVASLSEDVNDQAQQCNKKRRNAKIVEVSSGELVKTTTVEPSIIKDPQIKGQPPYKGHSSKSLSCSINAF